jgi:hypothetical protein
MTLISEVQSPRVHDEAKSGGRTQLDGEHYRNIASRSDAEPTRLLDDHLGLWALLDDDPVLEDWATEIAGIYRVSPLDVLETLALVLVRDGK